MSVSGYVVEPCPYCGKGTAVEHVRYDNCFVVSCLYCGYTSGHIASERGAMIRHNKLCRALPKPDPDWKDICAKCKAGDIEPKHCEYYGEPNGCNSPIYGEHPKSAPVGNSAAMREALKSILEEVAKMEGLLCDKAIIDIVVQIVALVSAALDKPPRNCDVGDVADWEKRFGEECDKGHICSDCPVRYAKTRMATELDKGARCEFVWAQMPYEAANESEAK